VAAEVGDAAESAVDAATAGNFTSSQKSIPDHSAYVQAVAD